METNDIYLISYNLYTLLFVAKTGKIYISDDLLIRISVLSDILLLIWTNTFIEKAGVFLTSSNNHTLVKQW